MLARVAELRAGGRLRLKGRAGVFVKAAKRGQDVRLDLPAVGPATIAAAKRAQLVGLAIAAGEVLIADRRGVHQGGGGGRTVRVRVAGMSRLKIALVAGEPSGDALGAKLIEALRELAGERGRVSSASAARAWRRRGSNRRFRCREVAVMGILPVLARLPRIFAHIAWAAEHVVKAAPDGLILIDSPDFTHRVARRVRAKLPDLPVIDYVSPTVWAWRPGRAQARCAPMSTRCWRCCRSSPPRTSGSAARNASMSAIR